MERKEILFDGYFYDVTDFVKKHPGGSIINYYTKPGEDSTHAIQQFHHRSIGRVHGIMSTFKKRPAAEMMNNKNLDPKVLERNRSLTEDFTKLYLELEKEGFFKPSHARNFLRLFEIFALFYVGYLLLKWPHFSTKIVGILLVGLSQGRAGWVHHECGHYSYFGSVKIDRFIQIFTAGTIAGLSSTWWRRGHNRHHAMPQRLNRDIDLMTLPVLSYNTKVVKKAEDGKGFLIKYQVYLFPIIAAWFGGMFWRFYSVPRYTIKKKLYSEVFAWIAHFVLFISTCGALEWYLASWLAACYSFFNFALSHTHLPVTTEPTHWVEYALVHTADVEQSTWCDYWMGYLNYQIEHHLFPAMPQFRQPLMKDRVKALAEKHNLPYIVYSYAEAVKQTYENLHNVSYDLRQA